MTREEAIKRLEDTFEAWDIWVKKCPEDAPARLLNEALGMAIAALREQGGSFQNGNNHNMVKDWPSYMDLPRERIVPDTNVGNKWISVEERLPERGQSVLILCKNKAKFTGYWLPDYSGEARWRVHTALNSAKLLNKGRVTHWMPLPEPPKEEV